MTHIINKRKVVRYNEKKRRQIAMRRLYIKKSPSKELVNLLGIDGDGFREHIDSYMIDGMTKENFGSVWGLDHIVPVEVFDINDEDDLRLCYNYNNIMPMFNDDNRMKGGSIHFSLEKLKSMPQNIHTKMLIKRCTDAISTIYEKYLTKRC